MSIQLSNLSLIFNHKICFQNFNTHIHAGQKIAIIGQNGSGKSSLLKILMGDMPPSSGSCLIPERLQLAYVPQMIETEDALSGGQKFNHALTEALTTNPDILLLDEPTNHLDQRNRKQLMKLLTHFHGTVIMATHDVELIETCADEIWHLYHAQIHIFKGQYQDYLTEWTRKRAAITNAIHTAKKEKKDAHQSLMKEQNRASKAKLKGEKNIKNRKYPTITSSAKVNRGITTSASKKSALRHEREALNAELDSLYVPEIIVPTFHIEPATHIQQNLVQISDGACGYGEKPLLTNLNIQIQYGQRIAILGNNGSGKSTLVKAILDDSYITKSGEWKTVSKNIGYLDQHYNLLDLHKSAFEMIEAIRPDWDMQEIRNHLNQFLFQKNEDVYQKTQDLSGGEKARLCLSLIAASPPQLLILDEVTNNLDLETRAHVIEVLNAYPGALLIISHDADFLQQINIEQTIEA